MVPGQVLKHRRRGPWQPDLVCPDCGRSRPFSAVACECGKEMPAPAPVPEAAPQVGPPEDGEAVLFTMHRLPGKKWGRCTRKGSLAVTEEGIHLWARRHEPLVYVAMGFFADMVTPRRGEIVPFEQITSVVMDPPRRLVVVTTAEVSHAFKPARNRFWPLTTTLRKHVGSRLRTGRVGTSGEQIAHIVYDGVVLGFLFLPFLAVALVVKLMG